MLIAASKIFAFVHHQCCECTKSNVAMNFESYRYGWRGHRDVLLSQGGPCVATLTYSAQLVKPGSLKFTYQYSDDSVLFQFQVMFSVGQFSNAF